MAAARLQREEAVGDGPSVGQPCAAVRLLHPGGQLGSTHRAGPCRTRRAGEEQTNAQPRTRNQPDGRPSKGDHRGGHSPGGFSLQVPCGCRRRGDVRLAAGPGCGGCSGDRAGSAGTPQPTPPCSSRVYCRARGTGKRAAPTPAPSPSKPASHWSTSRPVPGQCYVASPSPFWKEVKGCI